LPWIWLCRGKSYVMCKLFVLRLALCRERVGVETEHPYALLVTDLAQYGVKRLSVRVRMTMSLARLLNVKRWSFGRINADSS
jgi:hypothetical protein